MKRVFIIFVLVGLSAFALAAVPVLAQTETPPPQIDSTPTAEPEGPALNVHIVQAGDTLFGIAAQYETTAEILQQLNGIDDPTTLQAGQQLILPGGQGAMVATVHTIQLGDTLPGLAEAYSTTVEAIVSLNRIVHPNQLAAGQSIAVLSQTGSAEPRPVNGDAHFVRPGQGLLSVAAEYDVSPRDITAANDLGYPAYLFPGQRLRLPGDKPYQALPAGWTRVLFRPLPVETGSAAIIYVESSLPGMPQGDFGGQTLRFVARGEGFLALTAFDAFAEAGFYRLALTGEGERPWPLFERKVQINPGDYGEQLIQVPEDLAYLLAPEIRSEEDAFLATIYSQFNPEPMWQGPFQLPVGDTLVTAPYGDARSYNGGPFEIYHTGVDFSGVVGTPIVAPAAGIVVFSDTLQLRGDTIILDHGLGVMTGYYHLSRILVQLGDRVIAGQPIAEGGSSGLSTGPHLHWDVRVANVPVNGLAWTESDILDVLWP